MARFQDKVVFVTGAGRGFGAVLAQAFAKEGAHVVVHYNSSAAGAEETAARIRKLGRKTLLVKGNIASLAEVRAMTEMAFAEFGHIDVLVNNVGDMAIDQKSWREMDEKVVSHTLEVDIKGTMFMIHEVGQRMMARPGGAIVNIGSQVVIAGSPRAPQYAAAKYGVIGLTKSYAQALAPNVRVNTLGAAFMENMEASEGAESIASDSGGFSVKKGALWWISNRVRDEKDQVVVRSVVSPDLL